jgi:hypothetical protein
MARHISKKFAGSSRTVSQQDQPFVCALFNFVEQAFSALFSIPKPTTDHNKKHYRVYKRTDV